MRMKIVVDGRDLNTLIENKNELKGLELIVASCCDMDETVLDELSTVVSSLVTERFRNTMQMISYMKLQTLGNRCAIYSTDNTVMFLLNTKTKNYCNDLSLTCRFVNGMNRLEKCKNTVKFMSTENLRVEGLA